MSCGPDEIGFRLLDAYVGWDEARVDGIGGLADPAGLALLTTDPDAVGPGELDGRIPPRRLARGCGCEWFLAAEREPGVVLVRDRCVPWRPLRGAPVVAPASWRPTAVALWGDRLAVIEADADRVWLLTLARGHSPILLVVPDPVAVALSATEVVVATPSGLWRFDASGAARGVLPLPAALGASPAIDRVAIDADGQVWIAVRVGAGYRLFRHAGGAWRVATGAELAAAFSPTGVTTFDLGFCLTEPAASGLTTTSCFGWDGTPRAPSDAAPVGPPRLTTGVLWTRALDSGLPRCRWHRVRIDADVPPGTSLSVEVASAEDASAVPHDDDWTGPAGGALDVLIDQPAGRYLFVRLTLRGDGHATPRVRRVRLDMPRATSLDRLPEVYRDDPTAADFGERFLALFDAQIEALDRAIERLPALLDVGGVPDEVLPWLASLLGESLDPAWAAERRRALLAAAPELHRERGTVAGLRRVITLALGVEPVIEELAAARAYGSVGRDARLGSVRLHGRSRARFRVGRSPLGRAPLRSYGDPDDDVAREAAYRLRVRVPPIPGMTRAQAEARLRRLVEAQKPAHVVAATAVGAGGGVLGAGLVVGVDTVIGPPAAPVLGRAGNIRLSRASVLWRARREV